VRDESFSILHSSAHRVDGQLPEDGQGDCSSMEEETDHEDLAGRVPIPDAGLDKEYCHRQVWM
jgi:hypothetical protein